ncbi:MAG: hypothetical protein NG747_04775 [Candidatus Brocadia sp.]|nr:hypothetical protein [Candidatus Brocadia sp.]
MSKTAELHTRLLELNKNIKKFQASFANYKRLIADVSGNMNEALGIMLDKIQTMVKVVYLKDCQPEFLEKTLTDIVSEMNRLVSLKIVLLSLSGEKDKEVVYDLPYLN